MALRNDFTTALLIVVTVFFAVPSIADGDAVEFTAVLDCVQIPDEIKLGKCSGVGVDAQGRVFLLHRGKHPVLCFDKSGKFLRSFGDDYVAMGHGLKVDRPGNIWVTCTEHHMVYKFDADGKLLLAIGQIDKPGLGTDPPQFDQPTDVAVGPQGEIYVADGYGNSRMVKLSPDGKFLTTWGSAGEAPGEFHAPHQVEVDAKGRIIVADRDNNRLQIFDADGQLLEVAPVTKPFGVALDGEGQVFVCSGDKILRLASSGDIVQSWGKEGTGPLEFTIGHQIAIDRGGNLYVAEVGGQRLQKLRRR